MSDRMKYGDLRSILVEAAGSVQQLDDGQEIIDADLYDLGYDSLALMEMAARIKERFDVDIPDEEVTDLRTLRHILDRVNSSTGATA
ncbi:acyl carrier protein [Actinomadura sp. KC06]|uniref:acyl carrier protein n=1 Tax=Actinomadura sp. KC06 TaxID=2530369 RepID=UPI001A9E0CCE|nr:acyl carrier protein [Actinomadura sp. KC06]